MNIENYTIRYTGIFCLIALGISILTHGTQDYCSCFVFISNLFLGLFCSGVLVVLASIISAQSKFTKSVNKLLFYCKVVKFQYDKVFYTDINHFVTISQKIIECFDGFYETYVEIEFFFINRKFKNYVQDLFNKFMAFVNLFYSVTFQNEMGDNDSKINLYFSEAKSITKMKFHDFINSYVDLYTLWDRDLCNFMIDNDELTENFYSAKDTKHETIKQIIAQRTND